MTNKEIKACFFRAEIERMLFVKKVITTLVETSYTTRQILCSESSPWIVAHFMKKNSKKDNKN